CRTAPPPPSQALAAVTDVAGALGYASGLGVVHRDVKPANVFVTETGRCKLGDFGLARITSDNLMFRSRDGLARGTPLYMSPEQLRGQAIGPASDVYSLALLAWELLTASHPFADLPVPEIVEAHVGGKAVDLEPPSAVPRAVLEALRAGLSPLADDRPTAEELAEQLLKAAPPEWFEDAVAQAPFPVGPGQTSSVRPGNIWVGARDGGWTTDSVDDSTWPGPQATAETDGAASTKDRSIVSGSESAHGRLEIDDRWIRPSEVRLRRRGIRRTAKPTWLVGAFVLGFALIILVVELTLRH
ncbi:MAG: serine/threonine-protein kinase, partial [Nitrososphaerales archaeon]